MDQGASARLGKIFGTWFGIGYLPFAPGTAGTLAAMPLAWLAGKLPNVVFAALATAIAALGIWSAERVVLATGRQDPQIVVIDEVAGYLFTLCLVPRDLLHLTFAFFLFRLLDIWKPGPIGWLDRHVHGGLGVMADDLLAGILGAVLLFTLDFTGGTAWIIQQMP